MDVELPLRFDFAGGWSDTPPYSLERPARVLNMAIILDGKCPVGVDVKVGTKPKVGEGAIGACVAAGDG